MKIEVIRLFTAAGQVDLAAENGICRYEDVTVELTGGKIAVTGGILSLRCCDDLIADIAADTRVGTKFIGDGCSFYRRDRHDPQQHSCQHQHQRKGAF